MGVTADRYTVNFNPANALLEHDLPDTRGTSAFGGYYRDFGTGPIREVRGDVSVTTRHTGDRRLQRRLWYTGGSVELRQQVKLGVAYNGGEYRPVLDAPGAWSDTLNHDHYWTGTLDFNTRSSRLGYGGAYSSGSLGGGDYEYGSAYVWARPTRTTFVNATAEHLYNFGELSQYVVSAGWDITSRMTLVGRYINSEFGDAYRLAYSLNVAKNMDFFLVYDRDVLQPVKLSAKLVMTLH